MTRLHRLARKIIKSTVYRWHEQYWIGRYQTVAKNKKVTIIPQQ